MLLLFEIRKTTSRCNMHIGQQISSALAKVAVEEALISNAIC